MLAANKVNATSPNAAGTSLNMAQVNAATFAAGDQVLFSSQGGNYTGWFIPPSSGSGVGAEITYKNALNETPAIVANTNILITTATRSNIKIIGFALTYTGSIGATGITITAGTNITIQSCTVNMAGYGYNISSSANLTTVLLDSLVLTNTVSTGQSLSLTGTNNTITLNNITANDGSGRGISITNTSNLVVSTANIKGISLTSVTTATISDITVVAGAITGALINNSSGVIVNRITYGGTVNCFYVSGTSHDITINTPVATAGSGSNITDTAYNVTINDAIFSNTTAGLQVTLDAHDVAFNRCSSTTSADNGFFTDNNVYNVTYTDCNGSYNAYSGWMSQGDSHNIIFLHCVADYNGANGFYATDTAHDLTYLYSESSYNGIINVVNSNGGGIMPHANVTNSNAYYFISHHNYNESMCDVSNGTNSFYNGISWANGYAVGDTFKGSTVTSPTVRGNLLFVKAGGVTTVENIISGGSKPREISDMGAQHPTLNYNLYKPLDDNKFISYDNVYDGVVDIDIPWTTYHLTNETNSQNADPRFVNSSGTYSVITDFQPTALSPAIDAGTAVPGMTSTTTDFAGKPIYGTPDVGVYEYQPPHNLAAVTPDTIDIGAGARIYADGKFRDLGTTNATPAHLKITPSGGSFTIYDATTTRPAYLDITNIANWNNSHKTWTESNAQNSGMVTDHTIGDLTANKYYNVKVDNVLGSNITGASCTSGICLANGSGVITFTYSGGYSTHVFDVDAETTDDVVPSDSSSIISNLPETGYNAVAENISKQVRVLWPWLFLLILISLFIFFRKRLKIWPNRHP